MSPIALTDGPKVAETFAHPELLDLDLDELPPLPPAHSFSKGKSASASASAERISSLKPDAASRADLSNTARASPVFSAAPSSFRLEGSPSNSPYPADSPEPAQSQADGIAQISNDLSQSGENDKKLPSMQQEKQGVRQDAAPTPSARYVTVSAILSRSEMYYVPESSDHWDLLRSPQGFPAGSSHSHNPSPWTSGSSEPFESLRRKRGQRKRPSNGSAIEALGALLLRRDSSGRVANLSFARDTKSGCVDKDVDVQSGHNKRGLAPKHSIQAWTSALGSLGKKGLRLQLPLSSQAKASSSKNGPGATIAERRAQMWRQMLTGQGAVVEHVHEGFSKVHSRRGGLSFEVSTVSRKCTPSTILQLKDYEPEKGTKKEKTVATFSRGESCQKVTASSPLTAAGASSGRLPDTIVLKAGRRPRLTQISKSEFGYGSAYHDQTLPEAPPSPVAMPGAWQGGSSWRSKPGDGYQEGALLLPPPLLDDHGSDPSSFEGLLGVRRMREREKARRQAEKLAARNRPAHKVGPLTALTNFVKAAHAAETSAKRAHGSRRFGQPPAFLRSYTEPQSCSPARSGSMGSLSRIQLASSPVVRPVGDPISEQPITSFDPQEDDANTTLGALQTSSLSTPAASAAEADVRKSPAITSASPFISPSLRKAVLSRRGSRTNSIDAAGRQLDTVFEFEPLDPSQIPDNELASPDLPPISSPLLRPSPQGSIKASALRDFPAAPRLLPVQLSMPPSPFTPLAIDYREPRGSMSPPTIGHGDYLSARTLHTAPRTPQLGPTTLSLPPSPWTPYGDPSGSYVPPMIHLHLNTSTSSLRLPPGTPRLVPTHIEILPSPFLTSANSRRGSLSYDSPQGLRAVSAGRSPLTGPATDFTTFAALRTPQAAESQNIPARETTQLVEEQNGSAEAEEFAKRAESNGTLRLTPSSMLVAAQSMHDLSTQSGYASGDASRMNSVPPVPNADHAHVNPERKPSFGSRSLRGPSQSTFQVDASGRPRSFVLWFLIGDLGLRSGGAQADSGLKEVEADYGGIAAIFIHIFGLTLFVAAHLLDLTYSASEKMSLLFWFLRWMVYNLTGRTVLAQCIVEAYGFIQAEWATVALEDHEEKGSKKKLDNVGHRKPKGLTRWQVMRGLLELYCLHSVTRERYLAEGAGLEKLEGWKRPSKQDNSKTWSKKRSSDRVDLGADRAASRAALGEKRRSWAQQNSHDFTLDGEKLDSKATSEGQDDGWSGAKGSTTKRIDYDADDYEDDEDEDSSDDEMIVTNRGDDILEFAKTPRVDAVRPCQPSSGYFGRAYDFMTSPQVSASQPDSLHPDLRSFNESNRDLVRTIKWCGRLAISAYGLHVHIVDLPPTFTPSGERFSRQTFAYLSRLNADDVLHADIQSLDADADYSPTFYVVRDYVRKVVCIAVRGTQSFSDIIVDLELQTEEIELPQVQPTPGEEFRCHAGIWRAAKALVSPQSKLFATLRQALAENEGFGVMFCGHSLGGAIASAAALLLAEYFIPDGADPDSGTWVTNMSSGLPARRPIRAVSFASPVSMTADLAGRAALGSVPLVTTVVLGSDIIPRVGHGQIRELRRVLGALSRVRRRHAMASSEGQDDARVHILRSYWDWRSITKAEGADDVMLHRKERIEEQLWSLRRDVESDLYAAIKARLDAESTAGARIPPSPWVGPQQRDEAPLHALATRRQELDTATLRSEAAQGGPLIPPGRCIWINNKQIHHVESPLAFFSLPELRSDMFAAHFPAAYEEAILELRT